MTNKKNIALVLGIMCFALTVGICIQVKTVKNTSSVVSQNYEENNLRAEVLKYKEKYENQKEEKERTPEAVSVANEFAAEMNRTPSGLKFESPEEAELPSPKKKKKKHVQPVCRKYDIIGMDDVEIKRIIKEWVRKEE